MPKRSLKRKRSESNSDESVGIYKILKRIEFRLDKVEKKQTKTRRRIRQPKFSSDSETEGEQYRRSRSRERQSGSDREPASPCSTSSKNSSNEEELNTVTAAQTQLSDLGSK